MPRDFFEEIRTGAVLFRHLFHRIYSASFASIHFAPSSPLLGLTIVLLLADLRSGLGDAAFYEISLNLELLLRA
jgi:hypothetical protein